MPLLILITLFGWLSESICIEPFVLSCAIVLYDTVLFEDLSRIPIPMSLPIIVLFDIILLLLALSMKIPYFWLWIDKLFSTILELVDQ